MQDYRFLRKLCVEIVKGSSKSTIEGKTVFLKHFGVTEQSVVDDYYGQFREFAIKKGAPTEADKYKFLEENGLWTPKDDRELTSSKNMISNLKDTKRNLYLPSQVEDIQKQIDEAEKSYYQKLNERHNLLGTTVESFTNKKLNEIYVFLSLFKDEWCQTPYMTLEAFNELDGEELNSIEMAHSEISKMFAPKNIKLLAISPFFQNSFYLCNDRVTDYFGKPICSFSFYQNELASYGGYYKKILSENRSIPNEILEDPEKIEDYLAGKRNLSKVLDSTKKGGQTMIMGATVADMEKMGLAQPKKDGGVVEMNDRDKDRTITMAEMLQEELKNS